MFPPVNTTVSAPPVDPTVLLMVPVPLPPTPIRPRLAKLGRLNVVLPSPVPQVVPIFPNSSLYVVLLTADPSQDKNPEGADVPPQGSMAPAGKKLTAPVTAKVLLTWTAPVKVDAPVIPRVPPTVALDVTPKVPVTVALDETAKVPVTAVFLLRLI